LSHQKDKIFKKTPRLSGLPKRVYLILWKNNIDHYQLQNSKKRSIFAQK